MSKQCYKDLKQLYILHDSDFKVLSIQILIGAISGFHNFQRMGWLKLLPIPSIVCSQVFSCLGRPACSQWQFY